MNLVSKQRLQKSLYIYIYLICHQHCDISNSPLHHNCHLTDCLSLHTTNSRREDSFNITIKKVCTFPFTAYFCRTFFIYHILHSFYADLWHISTNVFLIHDSFYWIFMGYMNTTDAELGHALYYRENLTADIHWYMIHFLGGCECINSLVTFSK